MTALAWFLVGALGLVGLAIGSFLNVVVHRVPAGRSVVHPPSACPRCGNRIRPRDNVPVLGWLLLRGRCRDCGEPISPRYPLVELGTGVAFALVTWFVLDALAGERSTLVLPALLYLAAITVALGLIDLDVRRLPDAIVLPSYVVLVVLLGLASIAEGDWWPFVRALIGGASGFVFYFALAIAYPAGMGFGDVKLAGVLGLVLGWFGWGALLVGVFSGFLLGAMVSVLFIGLRLATRKSLIPFGPYMLAGCWIGVTVGGPLFSAYLRLVGLS
ncbi:prepilin peptidase [Aquipuribacter nitratireducens]|uniref:Prepilin leader peptidase/N-methyltransferase n=1 Tax=Aquipuribacter nitratireducens TaxID=650104 RepID=A0ABW0GQW0_9MICO